MRAHPRNGGPTEVICSLDQTDCNWVAIACVVNGDSRPRKATSRSSFASSAPLQGHLRCQGAFVLTAVASIQSRGCRTTRLSDPWRTGFGRSGGLDAGLIASGSSNLAMPRREPNAQHVTFGAGKMLQ